MIRYVLAVLLTVAILALAGLAIDDGATDNTEREIQTAISEIEAAAVELAEYEELSPADHPDPQRVVTVSIPEPSLTTAGVSHLEIEPVEDADASVARYVLEDGTTGREVIDQRIVYHDRTENRTTELDGTGTERLRLVLLPDEDDNPVVVAEPPRE